MRFLYCLILCCCAAVAQQSTPAEGHKVTTRDSLTWKAMAIPGLEMTVVSGNPEVDGPFVLRIRAMRDQKVPAHWHPKDEQLTVLAGSFSIGTGEKWAESGLHMMKSGDFLFMPQEMRHYASFKRGGEIQLHGTGPFVINWVNPDDIKALQETSNSKTPKK
jgi:hypothetical protein